MDIKEYTKLTGNFLTAQIVKENPVAVWKIMGEGVLITNKFGTERLHVPVKYGEEEYTFDMGKTNAKIIEEKLGADTNSWIGNAVSLETYRTKTTEGKMTDAINVKEALKVEELSKD